MRYAFQRLSLVTYFSTFLRVKFIHIFHRCLGGWLSK